MEILVASAAFAAGDAIPAKYSCLGQDLSPPITWEKIPEGTRSIALICDDPDAPVGTWVHWVIFNIPPDKTGLPEAVPADPKLPDGSIQGINDFRRHGYGGPCPPPGKPHRYFFKVYALDTVLDLGPTATKQDVEKAIQGHILARGELMGTFQR
ncbi:MAG TPA: YbhB/YbcL family Raf kinase inhibitor-like protein [Kiritimatiellae bacterium]|nr:YbhB/YbcL family Raf kinase inhibitor-like protein [Kiritimatiellia bacterium]